MAIWKGLGPGLLDLAKNAAVTAAAPVRMVVDRLKDGELRDGGGEGVFQAYVPYIAEASESMATTVNRLPYYGAAATAAFYDVTGDENMAEIVRTPQAARWFARFSPQNGMGLATQGADALQGKDDTEKIRGYMDDLKYRPLATFLEDAGNASAFAGGAGRVLSAGGGRLARQAARSSVRVRKVAGKADIEIKNLETQAAVAEKAGQNADAAFLRARVEKLKESTAREVADLTKEADAATARRDSFYESGRGRVGRELRNLGNDLDPISGSVRYAANSRAGRAVRGSIGDFTIADKSVRDHFGDYRSGRQASRAASRVSAEAKRELRTQEAPILKAAKALNSLPVDVQRVASAITFGIADTINLRPALRAAINGGGPDADRALKALYDSERLPAEQRLSLPEVQEAVAYADGSLPTKRSKALTAGVEAWRALEEPQQKRYLDGSTESEIPTAAELRRRLDEDVEGRSPMPSKVEPGLEEVKRDLSRITEQANKDRAKYETAEQRLAGRGVKKPADLSGRTAAMREQARAVAAKVLREDPDLARQATGRGPDAKVPSEAVLTDAIIRAVDMRARGGRTSNDALLQMASNVETAIGVPSSVLRPVTKAAGARDSSSASVLNAAEGSLDVIVGKAARTAMDFQKRLDAVDELRKAADKSDRKVVAARKALTDKRAELEASVKTAPARYQPALLASNRVNVEFGKAIDKRIETFADDLVESDPSISGQLGPKAGKALKNAYRKRSEGKPLTEVEAQILDRFDETHPEVSNMQQILDEGTLALSDLVEADILPSFTTGGRVSSTKRTGRGKSETGRDNISKSKLASENERVTGYTPLDARQASQLQLRDVQRSVQNVTGRRLMDEHGTTAASPELRARLEGRTAEIAAPGGETRFVTADDLQLLEGEDLVQAMDAFGYQAMDLNPTKADKNFAMDASQVKQDTVFLRKEMAKSFGKQFAEQSDLSALLSKIVDRPTRWWKNLVLALSPRWHVGNIVGNSVMLMAGGGMSPVQLATWLPIAKDIRKGLKDGTIGDTDIGRVLESGFHATERADLTGMDPLKKERLGTRVINGSYAMNQYVDDMSRLILYLDETSKGFSPERATNQALRVMGDYDRMSPFERNVARRAIPFYMWYRTITQHSLKIAKDNPGRAAWLASMEQRQGDGITDEWGFVIGDRKFSLDALNPYTTLTGGGDGGVDSMRGLLLGGVNPFAKAVYKATTGQDLEGGPFGSSYLPPGTDINDPGVRGNVLKREAGSLIPQYRVFRDRDGVKRYDDGSPRLDGNRLARRDKTALEPFGLELGPLSDGLLKLGGFGPLISRPYDRRADEKARRERLERATQSRDNYDRKTKRAR